MIELRMVNTESKNTEREVFLREIFKHKRRVCLIVEMNFPHCKSIGKYHNGYVECLPKNKNKSYSKFRSSVEELTFLGNWDFCKSMGFFGFDTVHSWNDNVPKSKTFEAVKKQTILLCNEMVKRNW